LVKEFPHIADQMKSVAKKRDKINKQALEDVSLLLKTAKEITFDKTQEPSNENPIAKQAEDSVENPEPEIPLNDMKLRDVVSKFKSKLNKNKVFPLPAEGIEITKVENELKIELKEKERENKEESINKNEKEKENAANTMNEKKEATDESPSSSSNDSENSEEERGWNN